MKKFIFILLAVIIVLVIGAFLARNAIVTYLMEKGARDLVGLKLTVDNVDVGLFSTTVELEEIKVYNPKGYTEKYLAEVKEVFVNYALGDIIKGFIHLPEVRINIKQVNAEKDKNGVINIDHVEPAPKEKKEKPTKAKGEFLVNKMVLEIGTIRYIDNTKTPPDKKVFDFNYSKTFTDISDTKVIIDSIVSQIAGKLVAEGISVTLKGFLEDKDFMGALFKGDKKGIEEAGAKNLEGLGKELERGIFSDDTTTKPSGEKKADIGEEEVGKVLEGIFGGKKKDK